MWNGSATAVPLPHNSTAAVAATVPSKAIAPRARICASPVVELYPPVPAVFYQVSREPKRGSPDVCLWVAARGDGGIWPTLRRERACSHTQRTSGTGRTARARGCKRTDGLVKVIFLTDSPVKQSTRRPLRVDWAVPQLG